MNIKAVAAVISQFDQGRDLDSGELLEQIGRMNVLAISGGRVVKGRSMVAMPVAHGYWVTVTLDPSDTYTVRRVFVRGGKVFEKKVWSDVYCTDIGETAYEASCYLDD